MSTVSISYGSLKDASNEAKDVAKKLNKYADSLYGQVCQKLDRYGGNWTSNLAAAKSKTNAKISELLSEKSRYETYTTNLIHLRDECKSVDKAVKSKVSTLTASFKEAHGIRNSWLENNLSYFSTSVDNATFVGRWLGGRKDQSDSYRSHFESSIKEWYNYEGGKELLKGVVVGALEIAIGVLAIASAILTGGALLVIIAGVVGGIIAVANGVANIWNEQKAYSATQNNDPATGRRRSKVNTWQDYLRSSFIFGDSGENYEYNRFYNGLATGIDIVDGACTITVMFSTAGKFAKNVYKWATGSSAKITDIAMKQIFSKDSFRKFASKMKLQFSKGFSNIKLAFKYKDWSIVKNFGKRVFSDIGKNLKSEFFNYSKPKDAVKSIKNMLEIPTELLKGDFKTSKIILSRIVAPSITAFTVLGDGSPMVGKGGQMQWNLIENVDARKFTKILEKGEKGFKSFKDAFAEGSSTINIDVKDKLSGLSNISISIPTIVVPNVQMPVLRAL